MSTSFSKTYLYGVAPITQNRTFNPNVEMGAQVVIAKENYHERIVEVVAGSAYCNASDIGGYNFKTIYCNASLEKDDKSVAIVGEGILELTWHYASKLGISELELIRDDFFISFDNIFRKFCNIKTRVSLYE